MSTTIGHYQIIGELGRGGMGVVYKAHEQSLNRFVAIKMLGDQVVNDPNLRARFLREARSAAALNHPNIIQIYFVGEDQGRPFFAMEYVAGVSLAQVIRAERQLNPKRAAGILLQAASGLARAHDQGIIHRDIKPGNIMIDNHGLVKLADFGIAHVVEAGDKLTATGQFLGTPGYLSPEVCLGRPVEKRSDLFSLGIVYYEMLTGQTPFRSDSPLQMLREVVETQVPDPRGLNAGVDMESHLILMKMVAKSPDQRYPDCHHLIAELKRYLGKDALNLMAQPIEMKAEVDGVPTVPAMVGAATAAAASASANAETEIITPYAGQTPPPVPSTPAGHSALPPQAKTELIGPPPPQSGYDAKAETLKAPPVAPRGAAPTKRGGFGRIAAVALLLLCLAAVGGWYATRPDQGAGSATEEQTAQNEVSEDQGLDGAQPPAEESQTPIEASNTRVDAAGDELAPTGTPAASALETGSPRPPATTESTSKQQNLPVPPPNNLQQTSLKKGAADGGRKALLEPSAKTAPASTAASKGVNPRALLVEAAGDPLLGRPLAFQLESLLKEKGYQPLDRDALELDGSSASVRELGDIAARNHARALVLAQITSLSQRELNYMGQYSTAYKVEVKIKCWSPGTANRLGEEFRTTLEYTTLTAEREAEKLALKAIDQLAENLE